MTTQELNRDIKRLHKRAIQLNEKAHEKAQTGKEIPEYYEAIEKEIKPEFKRLYRADNTFKSMNKQSILIMLWLNLLYRFEPLHMFGIMIEL